MSDVNVLFLCTGNSARSQMAEGLLRQQGKGRYVPYSAGLRPVGIHPLTVKVMDEIGIDVRHQKSQHVDELVGVRYYSYIITVCQEADENCPAPVIALGKHKLHWGFPDPAKAQGSEEEIIAVFRDIRDQISRKIQAWIATRRTL